MYKQAIAVTLLRLVAVSYAQVVGWTDCGTTGATIHSLNVGECGPVPCSFVRGNTYEIRLLASALSGSNHLPFNVTATFFGVEATVMTEMFASTCLAQLKLDKVSNSATHTPYQKSSHRSLASLAPEFGITPTNYPYVSSSQF